MSGVRHRLLIVVLAAALTAGGLSACAPQERMSTTGTPPIADVVAAYDAAAADIRAGITARYPDAVWNEERPAARSFGDHEGDVSALSPVWTATVPLSADEAARDRVAAAADASLRAVGFEPLAAVVARPGAFEYVAGDSWGGRFHLEGGSAGVVVSYETGSHPEG
jgi:hypothetical protein